MSCFLWIEDFESDIATTVEQVFGLTGSPTSLQALKGWLREQNILLKSTFFEARRYVADRQHLHDVDYVLIDIDLKPYEDYDLYDPQAIAEIQAFLLEHGYLDDSRSDAEPFGPGWGDAVNELKKVAGYHIFTQLLIDSGFPREHILFCSNHGDQLTSIRQAFEVAKLSPPAIYTKQDPYVRSWTVERRTDPYSVLRRGVLLGCAAAQSRMEADPQPERQFALFFNKEEEADWPPGPTTPGYLRDYLESLAAMLPLRAPETDQEKMRRYRIFIHVLSKEWDKRAKVMNLPDKSDYIASYGTILKEVRNWTSHTQLLDDLREADIAFIVMVNLRAMIGFPPLVQPHERLLLDLLERDWGAVDAEETRNLIGRNLEERKLPLDRVYFETKRVLEELRARSEEDYYFDQLVRELQKEIERRGDPWDRPFFLQCLYRMFWYYPSRMRRIKYGWLPPDGDERPSLFRHFHFSRDEPSSFAFQLARRLLIRSFPTAFGHTT